MKDRVKKKIIALFCVAVFPAVFFATGSAGAIVIVVEKSFNPSLEFMVFANFLKDRLQEKYKAGSPDIIHEVHLEENGGHIMILSEGGLKLIWEVRKDEIQVPADFLRQANKAAEVLLQYLEKRDLEQKSKAASAVVDQAHHRISALVLTSAFLLSMLIRYCAACGRSFICILYWNILFFLLGFLLIKNCTWGIFRR